MDWIDGAGWATVAMLVAASSLLPWYVAWLLPLAALASDRRLVRTAGRDDRRRARQSRCSGTFLTVASLLVA